MELASLSARDRAFCRKVMHVVNTHLQDPLFDVTTLSSMLGISRVTLYRKVRKIYHRPAGEIIREARLELAARLLEEGVLNISGAARLSGFHNMSYFSKCFKKKYHCPPSGYWQHD